MKGSFDFLVDEEHVLLHLGFVGEDFLANFTDVSAVHLEVVGQTRLGGTVNAAEMTDELRLLLDLGLADSLLNLLVNQFFKFFSPLRSPGQSVVNGGFAHLEAFVAPLETSVQQKFTTERTVLRVDGVNVLLFSDDF